MPGRPHEPAGRDRPAWRSPLAWTILLGVFVLGLLIDLWLKSWAFRTVAGSPVLLDRDEILLNSDWKPPWHEGVEVIPFGLLDFDLVLNHGAVFGIGQESRSIFIVFTIIAVIVAFSIFAFWTFARSHWAHIGIGLILAGGIGNLYDRIVFGAVRDFMHLAPGWNLPFGWEWPRGGTGVFPWVFNGADVFLLLGMAILILRSGGEHPEPDSTSSRKSESSVDVDQNSSGQRVG
jgi:signal peptidase II